MCSTSEDKKWKKQYILLLVKMMKLFLNPTQKYFPYKPIYEIITLTDSLIPQDIVSLEDPPWFTEADDHPALNELDQPESVDILEYHIKLVNIIGEPLTSIRTRSRVRDSEATSAHECLYVNFLSEMEPKKLIKDLEEERYLKGTPNLGLWYPKGSGFDLNAYSNSDYAGYNLYRKSTSGALLLDAVLKSYESRFSWLTMMFSMTRYYFIRYHILKGDIELHFVPTDLQLDDIFTKLLAEPSFTRLVAELGNLNGSHDQLNLNQQINAYCINWVPEIGIGAIIFSDLVNKLQNGKKNREANICYTRLGHVAVQDIFFTPRFSQDDLNTFRNRIHRMLSIDEAVYKRIKDGKHHYAQEQFQEESKDYQNGSMN
ncbi:hypothetical protein Tco_1072458 [Tanacetum coccineum]